MNKINLLLSRCIEKWKIQVFYFKNRQNAPIVSINLSVDELQRTERSVNGGPVYAYTECVLVADYSAYVKAQTISNSTDMNFVFSFMKIYYSHVMNSVSKNFIQFH